MGVAGSWPMSGLRQLKGVLVKSVLMLLGGILLAQPEMAAAQSRPRIIDHRTIVDPSETLPLILDGVRYTIPVNYLNTIIEPDDVLPHEVKSGFGLQGLYPDFAMRSWKNRDRFIGRAPGPETYRDLISADISLMCSTSPGRCTPERSWQSKQKIYRGMRFFDVGDLDKLGVNYVDVVEPAGLRLLGAANYLGRHDKLIENSWVSYSVDDAGEEAFVTCRVIMTHAHYNPRCSYYGKLWGQTLIEIGFSYRHISEWQSIRSVVLNKLRGFSGK